MSEMYAVPAEKLEDIADAIRQKRDITTPLTVDDMPLQISLIESGGDGMWEKIGDFTIADGEMSLLIELGAVYKKLLVYLPSTATATLQTNGNLKIASEKSGYNNQEYAKATSRMTTAWTEYVFFIDFSVMEYPLYFTSAAGVPNWFTKGSVKTNKQGINSFWLTSHDGNNPFNQRTISVYGVK